MGPAALDDLRELGRLRRQRRRQLFQRGPQVAYHGTAGGQVDRRREHVVAGLGRVDVVVGVNRAADPLGGQGRDHLVRVHVARRAGAGLEHVDRELVVPVAPGHLGRGVVDRLGQIVGEHPQLGVDHRGAALDRGQRPDQLVVDPLAGDRGVGHLALALGPGRHPDLAHRVAFDPVFRVGLGRGAACGGAGAGGLGWGCGVGHGGSFDAWFHRIVGEPEPEPEPAVRRPATCAVLNRRGRSRSSCRPGAWSASASRPRSGSCRFSIASRSTGSAPRRPGSGHRAATRRR